MSRCRKTVPQYTPLEWARMKERNGYALTLDEQRMLGYRL